MTPSGDKKRTLKSWPLDEVEEWMSHARHRDKSGAAIARSVGSNRRELARLYGRAGRLAAADQARRAEVDAAFRSLVASRKYTQVEIGEALGWPILRRASGAECRKLAAALRRARSN